MSFCSSDKITEPVWLIFFRCSNFQLHWNEGLLSLHLFYQGSSGRRCSNACCEQIMSLKNLWLEQTGILRDLLCKWKRFYARFPSVMQNSIASYHGNILTWRSGNSETNETRRVLRLHSPFPFCSIVDGKAKLYSRAEKKLVALIKNLTPFRGIKGILQVLSLHSIHPLRVRL